MGEAYIVAAARTAGGKRNGKVSGWHPADLAAVVLDDLVARVGADPALVEDVVMGCVIQAGEQSSNIARGAVLASKLPQHIPGVSVDRQCGSSQQALHFAAATVMAGVMDVVIAAGVESMTRAPMGLSSEVLAKNGYGRAKSPRQEARYPDIVFSQFTGAEMMAEKHGFSKDDMDAYGFESQQKAAAATKAGRFEKEICPIDVVGPDGKRERHSVDEDLRRGIRRDDRQRAWVEGARRRADSARAFHEHVRRRSRHHAGGAAVCDRQGAEAGRHEN